uniref:Uncharacterized protein n=1 Tax=Trichobilharzia regenti TaxID=157069 RepID=A0AA85J6G5_TRIRE|nr:unnamed protein product [Trichobilharzia regenti]
MEIWNMSLLINIRFEAIILIKIGQIPPRNTHNIHYSHERQQAALKCRIEASAATERRLKELLLHQKDVKQERNKRPSEANNPKR